MTYQTYWVYYVGVTNDLERRLAEHHDGQPGSFTTRHRIWKLVYAEPYRTPREAIEREKRLKRWRRAWEDDLVAQMNPRFRALDLSEMRDVMARLGCAMSRERSAEGNAPGDPGSGAGMTP